MNKLIVWGGGGGHVKNVYKSTTFEHEICENKLIVINNKTNKQTKKNVNMGK